jgi:hypothetical protein
MKAYSSIRNRLPVHLFLTGKQQLKPKIVFMKLYTILLLAIISATSCTHIYYSPNTANTPLFKEKGETRINGMYSTGLNSEFNGGELQLAHAVSKNFGVMLNGMFASKEEKVDDWGFNQNWSVTNDYHKENGKGSYLEVAGGFFKPLDEKKKWIGEIYAGVGFGGITNEYELGDYSKVNHNKIFLQPSIGYRSKHFEAAMVPKVSFINWKAKETRISQSDDYVKQDLSTIASKPGFVAFEPAFIFRGGSEHVKLQTAFSYSFWKSGQSDYGESLIEPLNWSIGISISLNSKQR